MSYRILGGGKVAAPIEINEELAAKFERYKSGGAYGGVDRQMRTLNTFFWSAWAVILAIFLVIDALWLPGLRYAPISLLTYILLSVVWLKVVCEWRMWRADLKGLELVPREECQISKAQEIEKLKKTLKFDKGMPRKKIVCCSGNGGGGHDATLAGLQELLEAVEFPADLVQVPMSWVVETHPNNPLMSLFDITGEQIYNWGLLRGPVTAWFISWATSWAQYFALRIDAAVGWIGDRMGLDVGDEAGKACKVLWKAYSPDLILDMTQGTHSFMFSGLARAEMLHIPMVVCVTDFEGTGIHKWIEHKLQYAVCGTTLCRKQAEDFGIPDRQIYQTSGMILRPSFYQVDKESKNRHASIKELGLDPSAHTCLVCWGGVGSLKVVEIGKAIARSKRKLNIIFLCGRNASLMEQLKEVKWPPNIKMVAQGFTPKVSHFMTIADFCVCKPGPGVASEAALLGLPIIVQWDWCTLPQEVPVAQWIISRGLGLAFSSDSQLTRRIDRMVEILGGDEVKYLAPKPFPGEGLSGVDMNPSSNKAVFEIPQILLDVLNTHDYTPFNQRGKKQ